MKQNFEWNLEIAASPERVWRYVADTNRVNQYAGLPAFTFQYIPEPDGGSRMVGETRYMGLRLRWDERPFEWIEGQRFEVVRAYHNGPIRSLRTSVRLQARNGGTQVHQTLEVEPRWLVAVPLIVWEVGVASKRRFLAAYRIIERMLDVTHGPAPALRDRKPVSRDRLQAIRERLSNAGVGEYAPRLIEAVETLSDEELDKMRPFAFADLWGCDRREVLKLFLHSAQTGLLDLSWDVVCPSCRGPQERHATLSRLRQEAHCPACNIRYSADFAESVEVTFRPNAAIRTVDVVRYCSGGPMNAPHVVAQFRVPARATRKVEINLSPGPYQLRSLKLANRVRVRVAADAPAADLTVQVQPPAMAPESLTSSTRFVLKCENASDRPIVMALERDGENEQAVSAAAVIALQEFRTLFAEEALSPETPISVGAVTLMFTDLKSSTTLYESIGDAPAYGLVQRHFDLLRECISAADGAIVKTVGDAVMAVFLDPAQAVEAGLAIHRSVAADNAQRGGAPLTVKIGVHYGPSIAVNQNGLLDYFGTTVNLAARIQKESEGGDIAITENVLLDPRVEQLLAATPHSVSARECSIRGLSGTRTVYVIAPRDSAFSQGRA